MMYYLYIRAVLARCVRPCVRVSVVFFVLPLGLFHCDIRVIRGRARGGKGRARAQGIAPEPRDKGARVVLAPYPVATRRFFFRPSTPRCGPAAATRLYGRPQDPRGTEKKIKTRQGRRRRFIFKTGPRPNLCVFNVHADRAPDADNI